MAENNLLLVDSNSLVHRAYHAYPLNLTDVHGKPVNAVYGFTSMLLDVLTKLKPKYVICAFDSKGPTFRHKEFKDYKAHRPKADYELTEQFKAIKDVLRALNIPILELEGYEADDIIGTVAHQIKKLPKSQKPEKVIILSNDKDLFQLVDNYVHMLMPYKRFQTLIRVTPKKVEEILGVKPNQVIDYKALVGDTSDNIPGVRGVGPKTAVKLLQTYGNLEGIYKNLEKIAKESPALYRKLEDGYNDAKISQDLAKIRTDVPLQFTLKQALLKDFNPQKAYSQLVKLQFKSLIPKVSKLYTLLTGKQPEFKPTSPVKAKLEEIKTPKQVFKINDPNLLQTLIKDLKNVKKQERGKGGNTILWVFYKNQLIRTKLDKFIDFPIVAYNLLDLFRNLTKHARVEDLTNLLELFLEIIPQGVFDIQLAGYGLVTGRTEYSLETLSNMFLGSDLQPNKVLETVLSIYKIQKKEINKIDKNFNKRLGELVTKIDPAVIFAIVLMEKNGICINPAKIKELSQTFKQKIKDLEQRIHQTVGFEFNVRSTQQLGNVLFNVLKLTPQKKRKTGYSTDIETLLELYDQHPVIPLIIEYRKLHKLYTTYVKPLETGKYLKQTPTQPTLLGTNQTCPKIHTTFHPLRTSTGRLASSNPNMQNIPLRTAEGGLIRQIFVPSPGFTFVSFDYSQIDLRVLAHTSQDPNLIKAFIEGRDIHRETAAKIFNKPYDQITDQERRVAKTINFGIVYGMSAYGLSRTLGISVKEAKKFLDTYFEQFPKVKEYMEKIHNFVLEHGFVLSLFGRRRFIVGIASNNPQRRQAAFREAINMPIQGGSDDILRKAIRDLFRGIPALRQNKIRLILQIHDELLFEVPNSQEVKERFITQAKEIMENVLKFPTEFSVPLKVGVEQKQHL